MNDTLENSPLSAEPNKLISGFHFRGHLPHLKREGAVYFVPMRLSEKNSEL